MKQNPPINSYINTIKNISTDSGLVSRCKQFPHLKHGNNKDSPSYFKISKIYENQMSSVNEYNKIKENNELPLKITLKPYENPEFYYHLRNYESKSQNIKGNASLKEKILSVELHPRMLSNEKSHLKNLNDFSIKESYEVNGERFLKINRSPIKNYNCLLNSDSILNLPSIQKEKWSLFIENYLLLGKNKDAFRKQKGTFSDYIDKVSNQYPKINSHGIKSPDNKKKEVVENKIKTNFTNEIVKQINTQDNKYNTKKQIISKYNMKDLICLKNQEINVYDKYAHKDLKKEEIKKLIEISKKITTNPVKLNSL